MALLYLGSSLWLFVQMHSRGLWSAAINRTYMVFTALLSMLRAS